MTFGAQVRLAGSVIVIASFFMHNLYLNMIGVVIVAVGTVFSVDMLERRIAALEPKEEKDDETEAE